MRWFFYSTFFIVTKFVGNFLSYFCDLLSSRKKKTYYHIHFSSDNLKKRQNCAKEKTQNTSNKRQAMGLSNKLFPLAFYRRNIIAIKIFLTICLLLYYCCECNSKGTYKKYNKSPGVFLYVRYLMLIFQFAQKAGFTNFYMRDC